MASLTVKNIPADLYELLKQSAAANRRSLNREIITCIALGVRGKKINPETLIGNARLLRQKTRRHPLTNREFTAAKLAGRL